MIPLERLFEDRPSSAPGPREPSFRMSTPQLGMLVLLASLSVLFVASLVGMLVIRFEAAAWPESQLPPGLIASTALLVGLGIAVERGRRAIRDNRWQALVRCFRVAMGFAVVFLASQALNFRHLAHVDHGTLYGFSFDLLMGLHGLHVIGGLVPLAVVARRAARNEYSSSRDEGVRLTAQYWHFLGVVWLVLVAALWAVA